MSLYQLQKLMFHTRADERHRRAYLEDPAAFLSGYELSEAERLALARGDARALYQMGVDPLLLLPFMELNGMNPPAYYAALAGLD